MRKFRQSQVHQATGVTRADLNLAEPESLRDYLVVQKPDILIHAAAKVGGIQANTKDPFNFLAENLRMDSNVVQTCVNLGLQNLIYMGSSCMYPRDFRQPLRENDILAAPLEPTNEGYAIAKIAGSRLCEYASESFGLNYKTLIPSNLYGPGDNFSPESSHLVASVIRKVHEAKSETRSHLEVWGSGSARREFTFIGDLADWIHDNLGNVSKFPHRLNLGFGADYSVDDYYRSAMQVIGYEVSLVHDETKPEGMREKRLDSSIARANFGWNPKTDIREGISATYEWLLGTKETVARL